MDTLNRVDTSKLKVGDRVVHAVGAVWDSGTVESVTVQMVQGNRLTHKYRTQVPSYAVWVQMDSGAKLRINDNTWFLEQTG